MIKHPLLFYSLRISLRFPGSDTRGLNPDICIGTRPQTDPANACTRCGSYASEFNDEKLKFSHVLIDEAGRAGPAPDEGLIIIPMKMMLDVLIDIGGAVMIR